MTKRNNENERSGLRSLAYYYDDYYFAIEPKLSFSFYERNYGISAKHFTTFNYGVIMYESGCKQCQVQLGAGFESEKSR